MIRAAIIRASDGAYAVRFTDPTGARRTMRVSRKKVVADEFLRRLRRMLDARASGQSDDPETVEWALRLPERMRTKLATYSVVLPHQLGRIGPVAEHVARWGESLTARGVNAKRVADQTARVRRMLDLGGVATLTDFTEQNIERAIAAMREGVTVPVENPAEGEPRTRTRRWASHTINGHRVAVRAFARWLVARGVLTTNPLEHLAAVSVRVERERRALTLDEQRWLLAVARDSRNQVERVPVRKGAGGAGWNRGLRRVWPDGPERAVIYRLALETGFRANELATLTRASFRLDADKPVVVLEGKNAKNRRAFSMRLRAETVEILREHLRRKAPAALAFTMPPSTETAAMLREDIERARAAWIEEAPSPDARREREESDFLAVTDHAGAVVDFHALRVSFITNMARAGVSLQQAQRLARHCDPKLTASVYTKLGEQDDSDALDRLPSLVRPDRDDALAATGTDGKARAPALQTGERGWVPMTRDDTEPGDDSCKKVARFPEDSGTFDAERLTMTRFAPKPPAGIEPATCALQKHCSAS